MSKETRVIAGEFKGNALFSIFTFDGEEQSTYPVVSFGVKKAQAILDHLEELQEWVISQEVKK